MQFRIIGSDLAKIVKVLDKMVEEVVLKVENGVLNINVMNIERTVLANFKINVNEDSVNGEVGIRIKDLKSIS